MKKVMYVMMIVMGAIIEIYNLKMDNPLSVYFGGAAIGYGSFAIVVDYLKTKRKTNNKQNEKIH